MFPAEQWPDQHGADLGLYRLCEYTWENGKRREKWFSFGGQKYTFITPEAMGQLIAKGLTEPGWLEALERPAPKFKAKDWVRWYGPQFSARQFRLRSDPFLWVDGQWRVLIEDLRLGRQLVCCDELVLLDRFGKEVAR